MMGFVQQISHLFESDVFMNGGYDIQQTPRNRRTPQQIVVVEFMRRKLAFVFKELQVKDWGKNWANLLKENGVNKKSNETSWSYFFLFGFF